MRTTTTRIAGASFVAAAALALSVGPAFAADGFVSANLKPIMQHFGLVERARAISILR